MIDADQALKFQSELMSGENLLWTGRPTPGKVFHSDDWYAIPFSLLWGGFFVFWESTVVKSQSFFMILWGIPFIVVGQYLIWGRFLYDAWIKRRTSYAITSRRVLILQEGWKRKTSATYLEGIPSIESEGTTVGTIWFGPKYPVIAGRGQKTRRWSRFSVGDVPVFADIDDVEAVHYLVRDLKEKTMAKITAGPR
jgi:hypothetical protein